MFYKISSVIIIAFIPSYFSFDIDKCSNISTQTRTVCKLFENYDMDYPPPPLPATIDVNIIILDIVDLDWTANTISIFIQLWTFWKDPRITISNHVVAEEIKEAGLIFILIY